ncbi:MAG: riboflavin biosynthesis protein RibF [Endomicrobiia bacterium]
MREYVAAIGFFDGVHIGHQKLISTVINIAKRNNLRSLIITFDTVAKIKDNLIFSFEEKINILKSFNIDKIKVLNFKKIKNLSAEEFFKNFILKNKISVLVVGEDFKFGYDASSDVFDLKKLAEKYYITLFVISDVFKEIKGKKFSVSSSLIRQNIIKNNFKEVEIFLGREYWIFGKVFRGKGLGRKIGIPTINFVPKKNVLLPKGVFVGLTKIKNFLYPSVANFGYNPTVNFKNKKFFCEVHIIDKKIDFFVKEIYFRPLAKIREEKKFSTIQHMRKRILKDIEYTKNFFYKKFYS